MNAKELAIKFYKEGRLKRRREIQDKHQHGYYVGGSEIAQGKTKAQLKKEKKEAWKNRYNDPNYKGLRGGYLNK